MSTMPNDLTASVIAAVDAMPWLTDADQAAVDLAKTYAAAIDEAIDTEKPDVITKALYLGPHLLKALAELGATPAGRKALGDIDKEKPGGKLAQLRSLHGGKSA